MCLPSDALLQHLSSYSGFSYLERGVSLHGCSSKTQPLLLTLDEGYLLTPALPDLQHGIAPLGPPLGSSRQELVVGNCKLLGQLLPLKHWCFLHLLLCRHMSNIFLKGKMLHKIGFESLAVQPGRLKEWMILLVCLSAIQLS